MQDAEVRNGPIPAGRVAQKRERVTFRAAAKETKRFESAGSRRNRHLYIVT